MAGQSASIGSTALRASALFKRYGSLAALNNLSLSVERGQCVGLLGPNGAGKSTALSILAGLKTADVGSVCVMGKQNPSDPETRRAIGLVPQEPALYPELTVCENLEFFGALHGLRGSRLRQRVAAGLELAALEARSSSLVRTLSGGMQRRLNLACAMVHDPAVLLLDEPTVGVDQQSRQHLFDCVRWLKTQKKAIVYCSHYMEEVEALCDWVTIIDNGQAVAQGTPTELLNQHGGSTVLRAKVDAGPLVAELAPYMTDEGWLRLPCANVRQGLDVLLSMKVDLGELRVERARLEDVVLSLTGRRLRDA